MENYVAILNEHVQRTRSKLRYEDVGCVGFDHIKTFTIRAVLNDEAFPEGVGKNKKEAKQKAAENAWRALMQEPSHSVTAENATPAPSTPAPSMPAPSTPAPSAPAPAPISQANFMCWLNEYGHKNRVNIKPVESTRVSPHGAALFVVGDKEYPEAVAKTKKEAKEEAAKLVYNEIGGSEESEVMRSTPVNQPQGLSKLNVPEITDMMKGLSVMTADEEKNYISLINEHCQKNGCSPSFVLVDQRGPSHVPQFYYKLLINHQEYPVGEGKTTKEAKKKAAQLAWSVLQSPSCLGVSGDVPAEVSTPKSSINVCETGSETAPGPIHNGVRFARSPASPKDQSSDAKCRRRLAANFPNSPRKSEEEIISGKISASEETKSSRPRFTSDFDSIASLGRGGFGHVFKARHKLINEKRAVKVVHFNEKALREVKALSKLNHRNIIRYYECWLENSEYPYHLPSAQDSQYLYIQMELCSPETLRQWINEKNQNQNQERKEESLLIFRQIVSGVEFIHSSGLIHRDLKPENIMFSQKKELKIGDFGLATDGACGERTVGKGTVSYMAPEQKDKKMYDRKVDIFPLGLIYFELLWKLSTEEKKEVWDDVRNQETPAEFLPSYPLEYRMIKKMLSVNPEERPEAKEVQRELEKNEPCERKTV